MTELFDKFRETAVREIVPAIEVAKPNRCNEQLAGKLYEFLSDMLVTDLGDVGNEPDRATLIEDVVTTFDHDLSDYLMLGDYSVRVNIIENGQDPVFKLESFYKKHRLTDCNLSKSSAQLMRFKRKLACA